MASGFTPVKIILLVTLLLAVVLSIISLCVNDRDWGQKNKRWQVSIAFNIIGLLLMATSAILFLIQFFACQSKYNLFMILVVVFAVLALISFSIATGTFYHPLVPVYGAWVLSAVWDSVLAIVVAIIFLVMGS
ncbi:hypothetical protein CSKR_107750 [Clonorchis sinensis]|uniref:MARVEL domain-containing protein n=1 Tax=Clonorchis sinensis TaxID=79923 RepID=A0A8T1M5M0_CLOSI|nr:hypothetical protein CSKR_107750 [Clonorchis sinensis]